MKDYKQIEQIEEAANDAIAWMEDKLKSVVEEIMEQSKVKREESGNSYDWGYADGTHDTLLDILNAFDIHTDEEYSYTVH